VILTLTRLRQEDYQKFKASQRLSQKKKKEKRKKERKKERKEERKKERRKKKDRILHFVCSEGFKNIFLLSRSLRSIHFPLHFFSCLWVRRCFIISGFTA